MNEGTQGGRGFLLSGPIHNYAEYATGILVEEILFKSNEWHKDYVLEQHFVKTKEIISVLSHDSVAIWN